MTDQEDPLSEREIEILRLVATGVSNKEIASALTISPNTVKVHMRNIFAKVGVVSRTEATLYAIKNGIVPQVEVLGTERAAPAEDEEPLNVLSPLAVLDQNPLLPPQAEPGVPKLNRPLLISSVLVGLLLVGLVLYLINQNRQLAAVRAPTQSQPALVPTPARWSQESPLPAAKTGMGTVFYNDLFYIIGGHDGSAPSAEVLQFDPATGSWKNLAPKPSPAAGIQASVIGDDIYVPGGSTTTGVAIPNLEVYNPRLDQWLTIAPLPKALAYYALTAYEGRLYLFGGVANGVYSKDVYIYDPTADQWSTGSAMPDARAYFTAGIINGKIVLAGGENDGKILDDVMIYLPARDQPGDTPWLKGPSLPQPRAEMSSISLASMVYLFGGRNSTSQAGLPPLLLDPTLKNWIAFEMPGDPGSAGTASAMGNYIHLFGGQVGGAPSTQHWSYLAIYTISIPLTNKP